jgi:hypothetical protein
VKCDVLTVLFVEKDMLFGTSALGTIYFLTIDQCVVPCKEYAQEAVNNLTEGNSHLAYLTTDESE